MIIGATLLLACGSTGGGGDDDDDDDDNGGAPGVAYCQAYIDCRDQQGDAYYTYDSGDSRYDVEDCVDDIEESQREARADGCGPEFFDAVSCLAQNGQCDDGGYLTGCERSLDAYISCASGYTGTDYTGTDYYYTDYTDTTYGAPAPHRQACENASACAAQAGGSLDVEQCIDDSEASQADAVASGCAGEYDEVVQCSATASCDGETGALTGCDAAFEDYVECIVGA